MSRGPSPILATIAQSSLYVIKLLAVWIFFRGHQEPGGGFIAGVILAAAVALQGLVFGYEAADRVLPFPDWALMGTGLAISLSTVVMPTLLGQPFMKSAWGYLHLPFFGELEWASVALFDLGVLLVVVGSAKAILLHIADEKSADAHSPGEAESGARRSMRGVSK